ncbi:MAG TPA: GntR family transcriptional regulator [Steroidobacteraceae bacterium]|nr:GntR family transcriptional regulator [Steroidobacteraceae bacterium]
MAATTNTRTGVTRYLQVYTVLAQALADGSIPAGEALPSEPTLVRNYGVSRTTVRRALARLAAEGSIVRRRGSGTFARGKLERFSSARHLAPLLCELRTQSSRIDVKVLTFERLPTPHRLRRQWPDFGETVLTIRRVGSVRGEPIGLSTTYVPEWAGRELTLRRLGGDPILIALQKLGHRAASGEQETTALAADPLVARHLSAGIGAPLLSVRRLIRDAKGRILEYSNFLFRPDRYELAAVTERGSQRSRAD